MSHILVAVHHPELGRTLATLLRNRVPRSHVEVLPPGEGLADWLAANDADMAIVDQRTPGGCTRDLIRSIKALRPGICVICLAREDLPEYRQLARSLGADRFCSTSGSFEQILAQVNSAISQRA